jgi:WD40 repeat protein
MSIRILDLQTNQISKMPDSDGLFAPRWSFNGRYLAALSADGSKLMLYSFVTRKWEELAKINANYFSWSSDSRYLYFTTLGSDLGFMRVNVPGEYRVEKLASLKDVRLFMGNFGWWTGLTLDNSLLILRDTTPDEIYALDMQLP